ncbi:MAG: hypothetical protein QM692_03030, partial [Thermomicrobiales bacterium]
MLPEGIDYSALERNTSRYITERRREIQRRGQEAGRRLMELAIGGESLEAMATDLSRLAGRAVAIEGRDGRILALSANAASRYSVSDPDAILLPTRATVQAWLRSVAATSSAEPPTATYPTDSGWSRIVAPVIGRDGLLGNVSLLVPSGE